MRHFLQLNKGPHFVKEVSIILKSQEDSSINRSNQNKSNKTTLSVCIASIHGFKSNNVHKDI